MQHLREFENTLMNKGMVGVLDCNFVSLKSATIVLSRNKTSISLVKYENKATDFFLSETQLNLGHHLSEVIWLDIVFVCEVGYSKNGLRSDSQFLEALWKDAHNLYFSF